MSITIGVRFRPVDKNDRPSEEARNAARERWASTLRTWPGVLSFDFRAPVGDPPIEQRAVRAISSDVPPVDVTVVFESGNHADAFFGNSDLVANLNGTVRGAHAIHTVGRPEDLQEG
jgi:hypothetical protein